MFARIKNRQQDRLATNVTITGMLLFIVTQWFFVLYVIMFVLYVFSFWDTSKDPLSKTIAVNTMSLLLLWLLVFLLQQFLR